MQPIVADIMITWGSIASGIVIWGSMCTLNRMSVHTSTKHRIAHILVGSGAAAMFLAPGWVERIPTIAELLLLTGVSLLMMSKKLYWRRITRV